MEANKKILLFMLIGISASLIRCSANPAKILSLAISDQSTAKPQAFYVSELIKDWNKKHSEVCNVLLFDTGSKSDIQDDIIRKIPKVNPVINVEPQQCEKLENREGSFIIITSDVLNAVNIY